jgi:SNF2 family DNA or RNA helicase
MKQWFPESVFFNDAKTPQAQEQLVRDWNAGKIRILYAHPGSCGHGLNLQYGSHVLVYPSLTYNREHYEQMICRFARRGQTEITKVYRLMVPGTVDDAVAEALANKAENEARLIAALQMLESYRNGAK